MPPLNFWPKGKNGFHALVFTEQREECCTNIYSPLLFPCLNKDVFHYLPLTTIYCFVLLSWQIANTDVSVKMITLVYYCQHSGFFSKGRWKTHLCWTSYNNKNNNKLSLQATWTMFFDSMNYFKKLFLRLHKLSSLTHFTMNLYILTTCKGLSCLVRNDRFLHWDKGLLPN